MTKNKSNINSLVASGILGLKPYQSARDECSVQEDSYTFLDANEHPVPSKVNRYPDPYQTILRRQIASTKGIPVEQILLGNGSDEVLDLIFRVFCEPGDAIITLPPTYGMYQVLAEVHRVTVQEVLLTPEFQPNVPAILQNTNSKTKLLFLCSPNNPSGNLMDPKIVRELLNTFPGMIVIDEAYIDFANAESWSALCGEYPNLIVLQTFSKAYGMAGIRLGMAVANRQVIEWLKKVKLPYNVNVLTQEFASRQLLQIDGIKASIALLQNERKILAETLKEISFVEEVFPSAANFLLVRVQQANEIYMKLLEKGIVVRNRSNLPNCKNCLRITVGTPEENNHLIKTLRSLQS